MPLDQLVEERVEEIRRIAAEHGVTQLFVFGSVARGEPGPNSDLDLLVEVGPKTSSWFPAGLILDLEALLGCRVDVTTKAGLHPLVRESVLRDARPL